MPDPVKKLSDRYYDPTRSGWEPLNFDAIEIHGVADLGPDENGVMICEQDDDRPQFFSVYLHNPNLGVDCVGDFSDYADAEAYANELAATYHWPIYGAGESGITYPREVLPQPEVPTQQPLVLDTAQIDWTLLRQQKLILARLVILKTRGLTPPELEAIEGVLSFLDDVDDKHLES